MLKYLLKHAIANVWCSPFQDDQALLLLSRVSPIERYRDYYYDRWERVALPTLKEDYHVYQIGQNNQTRLNLSTKFNVWVNAAEICATNSMTIEFYLGTGIQLCRSRVWIMLGEDYNYTVAIQMQDTIANIDYVEVFMRVYKNAYFGSDMDTVGAVKIACNGGLITSNAQALALQQEYLGFKAKPKGFAYAFNNGFYVDNFLPDQVKVGDHVEYLYDASVDEVVDFKIDDLLTFTSELDGQLKFLLHPPKKLDSIDYRDDIDLWIIKKSSGGRFKGRYYNRNAEVSVRMVTHRDWSVPTSFVQAVIDSEPEWLNTTGLYLRVVIRKAGYNRPLVDEHHRIKELYKLTDAAIIRAMIGLDSTVVEWTAATLEKSAYTRIMRSFFKDLSAVEVLYAYGYNATAKLVGDTPVMVKYGSFKVPIGYQWKSTVYEYDEQGLLTGWRYHSNGDTYYPMVSTTKMVEFVDGEGGRLADFQLSKSICVVDKLSSYRFYVSPINVAGVPFNDWKDVTDDPDYYTVGSSGIVSWKIDPSGQLGVVKGNSKFISYDLDIAEYNHVYKFTLNHSSQQAQVLHIPPGRLDIWMNGRALVENIDYFVNYPEVVVCNKEYLKTGKQSFTIRGYHFCKEDMTRELSSQRGYIKHGFMSVNNIYDLRDDKVVRVVAAGRTFHRDQVSFAEDQRLVTANGLTNGRPYLIQDVIVPVRGVIDYDTYPLRASSIDLDERVSDYLTSKLPELNTDGESGIINHYELYSPTMGRLIYDMGMGLVLPLIGTAPESEVAKLMLPYLHLLIADPCRQDMDFRYLSIHPHPSKFVLTVTQMTYVFLQRINMLYLYNRVNLSHFLAIEGEGETVPEVPPPPVIPDPDPIPVPPARTLIADETGVVPISEIANVKVSVTDTKVYGALVSLTPY
jgi:hypothetical protein